MQMIPNPLRNALAFTATLFALTGCLIMPLPPDNGGSSSGGGGNIPNPNPPNPSGEADFIFSNQSSRNLTLTYHIDSGAAQTAIVSAGQTQNVTDIPQCSCFTVDNFTPSGGTQTEGFSVEACSQAEADFTNATGPFPGVTTNLSGGGPSTGVVTFNIQNISTKTLKIFPIVNGVTRASFLFIPGSTQTITVDRCQRLRVLAQSPTLSFADVAFVESPATTGAIYVYSDLNQSQVQVQKQP